MTRAIRRFALAAGAAALLSAQAAYAAPAPSRSTVVDPLVSLSVLSTTQSRAAVCSGATFGAGAAAACGLPATVPATSAAAAAAAAMNPENGKDFPTIGLIIGLALVIALAFAITSGGGDSEGNLTPISPA